MSTGILLPADIGPQDAARVLAFVNAAPQAQALADAVGFSEGPAIGLRVATAILAARDAASGLRSLDQILAATTVSAARFTELAIALSGARPPHGGAEFRLLIRPDLPRPWLGQRPRIVVQVTDPQGRGMPNIPVTCITTWGILTARTDTAQQRGASITMNTGQGGLLSLSLQPPLTPPLPDAAWSSLAVALESLGDADAGAARTGPALAALADRYRLEASEALRTAIDRLHETFGADPANVNSGFPVLPVTLMALTGETDGPAQITIATLLIQNWLGAFLEMLSDAVTRDDRLATMLAPLQTNGATGENLARGLIGATRAVAGLERGRLGQAARDEALGGVVNHFVAQNIERFDAVVLADVVRAAAASGTAISSGGFAVFNAIETTKDVRDVTGIRGADAAQLNQQLATLDGRMDRAESSMVTQQALDAFGKDMQASTNALITQSKAELTTQFDGRLVSLENDRVGKADLAALDTRLSQRAVADQTALRQELNRTIDTRLGGVALSADLSQLQTRLTTLEGTAVQRGDLQAEIGRQTATQLQAVTTRLDGLERTGVTQSRLDAFGQDILAGANANAQRLTDSARTDLGRAIAAKADTTELRAVDTRVSTLQVSAQNTGTRLDTLDQKVGTVRSPTLNNPRTPR